MKLKLKTFVILMFLCMMVPMNYISVCAQSKQDFASSSFVDETITGGEYDVLETEISLTSAYVTRKVTYNSIVTPPTEMSWTETLNGSTYSGVLTLKTFYYDIDKTVATYAGYLEKQ